MGAKRGALWSSGILTVMCWTTVITCATNVPIPSDIINLYYLGWCVPAAFLLMTLFDSFMLNVAMVKPGNKPKQIGMAMIAMGVISFALSATHTDEDGVAASFQSEAGNIMMCVFFGGALAMMFCYYLKGNKLICSKE